MSRKMIPLCLLVALLLNAAPVANASAQGVQYTETTKISMPGAMGIVARLAKLNSTSTTFVTEYHQRSDEGKDNSTIVDLDQGHMVMLDHKKKTYTVMRFSDMAAMADQVVQQYQESREEVVQAEAEGEDGADVKVDFDVAVERTGKRERINGADAEQVLMTIQADVTATSEEETASGTFYVVIDSWTSQSIPGWATVDAFNRHMSEKMGTEMQKTSTGEAVMAAMQSDPRMGPALERAAEELADLEGVAVRTVMHMVLVAEGAPFDRDKVLGASTTAAADEKPKRRGLGGLVQAAQQLANQSESSEREEQTQATLMTMVMEMSDVKTASIDPSIFSIPPKYKEVTLTQ